MTVLQVGNDFRLTSSAHEIMTPVFLPLVPLNLLELIINGEWMVPSAEEIATIRRGCRLRKLVLNGVWCDPRERVTSFEYREAFMIIGDESYPSPLTEDETVMIFLFISNITELLVA